MSRAAVIAALGTGQIIAWGASYYLPAVLADPIAGGVGVSRDWFFGAFSLALLLSGLLGPFGGRAIDRWGGRRVLACSNLLFAAGLLLLAAARGPFGLGAAWLLTGVAMGFGLYEAAFATLTGLYGMAARGAISGVTLFGGFASTVAWPVSAYLAHAIGWRGACIVWAVLHVVVALPLNLLVVPPGAHAAAPAAVPPPVTAPHAGSRASQAGGPHPGGKVRVGLLVTLSFAFAVGWFVSGGMAAHLPRLLQALGATPDAALAAAALVGPAQVAARLGEWVLLRRVPALLSARIAVVLHPIGAALAIWLGAPAAVAFTVLHGAGNGMLTIARGTVPLALLGPAAYGARLGLIAAPARILQGGAPLLFAVVLDRFGPVATLMLSSGLMLCVFAALLSLRAPRRA